MLLEFQALFQASPISWIQYIGGGVGGWGAVGGFLHTFEQKSSQCVFIEVRMQTATVHLPGRYGR